MADSIPAGFAARKSGLLVKGDLALEATANTQFTWQLKGLDDPAKRGQDSYDLRKERLFQEIETSRRRDPLIFRAVDYYDKLGIGIGIELSSDNEDVLVWSDAVWESNDLDDGQHQASNELVTTGNLYTRVPVVYDGDLPIVQLIPSSQIERIATENGRPVYYRRRWEELVYPEAKKGPQKGRGVLTPKIQTMYEDIPAAEMVHTAINRTAGELRGTSMLEPSIYWTALYGRILETTWAAAVAKSMVAYHVQIDAANIDTVNAVKALIEGQLVTKTDPRGQMYQSMNSGQMLATGKDVTVTKIDSDLSAGSLDAETRRVLLAGAAGMGIPEVFLSDGNNANRATSQSQSDPYFRMMQSHQQLIIKHLKRVYRLVFDRLAAEGRFTGLAIPKGKTHISEWLEMAAPNLLTPDVETLGPVAVALVDAQIWSREYAISQLGVSKTWDEMAEQIEAEKTAGFVSQPPLNPGLALPPASRAAQINLPLAASVAVDDTPAETPTVKAQTIMARTLAAFLKEAEASKGDAAKIEAARQEFVEQARLEMFGLIDQTRELGVGSVAA